MKKVIFCFFSLFSCLVLAQNQPQVMDASPVPPSNIVIPDALLNRVQRGVTESVNTSLPISGPTIGLPPDSGNLPVTNPQFMISPPKITSPQKNIKPQVLLESNIREQKLIDKLRLTCATSFKDFFQYSKFKIKDIQPIENVAVRQVAVDEIYNNTITRIFRIAPVINQYNVFINYTLITSQGNLSPNTFMCEIDEDKHNTLAVKKINPTVKM